MAHAAKAVGASERSAYDAHKILRKDPAVFNELLTGKQTSMRAALRAVGSDKGAAGRDTPPTARRRPGAQRKAAPKPAKQVPEHVAAQARIRARDAELKYESMLNAPPNKLNIPMLDRASKVQELLLELSGLKPEVAVTQMPALRCREYAGEHSATMAAWWARFVELCEERRRTETPDLPPVYKRSRLAAVNPVMGGGGVRLTPAAQAVSDWLEKQNEPVTVVEAAVAVRVTRETAHKALRQICQMGDAEEIGKAGSFILYQWTGA